MSFLSTQIIQLTADTKSVPAFSQYLFVFCLVVVMYSMKEYVSNGVSHLKDQLDDRQEN